MGKEKSLEQELYDRAGEAFSLTNRAWLQLLAVIGKDPELDSVREQLSVVENRLFRTGVMMRGVR
jgi:hypothetical protein